MQHLSSKAAGFDAFITTKSGQAVSASTEVKEIVRQQKSIPQIQGNPWICGIFLFVHFSEFLSVTDTPTAKARGVLIYIHFQIYSKAYETNEIL